LKKGTDHSVPNAMRLPLSKVSPSWTERSVPFFNTFASSLLASPFFNTDYEFTCTAKLFRSAPTPYSTSTVNCCASVFG